MTRTKPVPARHATAIVDTSAVVDPTATIGPYAIIGPDVEIGPRVRIGPHAFIERDTRVAEEVHISKGAVLGTDPQDLKYAGERTFLHIGARTRIREFATLNRGTAASGVTTIGEDCLIMAYAHVAHDCRIGDNVVLANAVNMGGHVEIEEWAIVGGLTALHQFVRIGRHAMVGGASRVSKDVAPYTLAAGSPCHTVGINRIGLSRRGFDPDAVRALGRAFRRLFRGGETIRAAIEAMDLAGEPEEVAHLVEFLETSERGVTGVRRSEASSEGDAPAT